jgi:hypothetical protein
MKRIFKFLSFGLLALALVIGIAVFVTISKLDGIVKSAVEKVGSETLGTAVTLEGVNISLREGSGGLRGLKIRNPEGFSDANAFELSDISINLDIASLRTEEIIIESIVIDGAHVLFEEIGGQINLQKLMPEGTHAAETEGSAEAPKIVIQEFRFTNAQASLSSEKLETQMTVPIPDIVLRDIGKKGAGLTAAEASNQLLEPLIQKVLEGSQEGMVEQLKQKATSKILDMLSGEKAEE